MTRTASASHRALGKAIRAAREAKGYSQESFALSIGMDRSFYSAVERGVADNRLGTLLAVATGLESSLGQLCAKAKL